MSELPAELVERVASIQRASISKNERIAVRIHGHLDPESARRMADAVATWAGIDKKRVLILGDNAELFIAEVDGELRRMCRETDG